MTAARERLAVGAPLAHPDAVTPATAGEDERRGSDAGRLGLRDPGDGGRDGHQRGNECGCEGTHGEESG